MKQNIDENNKNKNELFTKKVKEEIKIFQENTTFRGYNNNFDSCLYLNGLVFIK